MTEDSCSWILFELRVAFPSLWPPEEKAKQHSSRYNYMQDPKCIISYNFGWRLVEIRTWVSDLGFKKDAVFT